jgi:RHS repeat-associated protein
VRDCPFRYQGQYEDTETGLYYNRFRYYDPETGQYISQDPIRLKGGIALHNYVSNPNTSIDVFGLSTSCHGKTPKGNLQHYSGTQPPLVAGASPNSLYSHVHPKTGKVVQNAVYDANGDVIGHVSFKNHGLESGHWHEFPPAQPGLGHGKGAAHNPHTTAPDGWNTLPPGIASNLPIGSL